MSLRERLGLTGNSESVAPSLVSVHTRNQIGNGADWPERKEFQASLYFYGCDADKQNWSEIVEVIVDPCSTVSVGHLASSRSITSLLKVRIEVNRSDHSKCTLGWLEKVEVRQGKAVASGLQNNETVEFPVTHKVLKDTIRSINANLIELPVKGHPEAFGQYQLTVKTKTNASKSHDSLVFAKLIGTASDSGYRELRQHHKERVLFQSGNSDSFSIEAYSLGELEKVSMKIFRTSDGFSGRASYNDHQRRSQEGEQLRTNDHVNWDIQEIEVVSSDGKLTLFPGNTFAAGYDGERLFKALGPSSPNREAGGGLETDDRKSETGSRVDYEIHVTTADIKNAGTDAHIAVTLFGEKGNSGLIKLQKSISGKDKFERGNTDVFEVPGLLDLGVVSRIDVKSDNHHGLHLLHPQWLCERIEVIAICKDIVGDVEHKHHHQHRRKVATFECGPQRFSKSTGLEHSFKLPARGSAAAKRLSDDGKENTGGGKEQKTEFQNIKGKKKGSIRVETTQNEGWMTATGLWMIKTDKRVKLPNFEPKREVCTSRGYDVVRQRKEVAQSAVKKAQAEIARVKAEQKTKDNAESREHSKKWRENKIAQLRQAKRKDAAMAAMTKAAVLAAELEKKSAAEAAYSRWKEKKRQEDKAALEARQFEERARVVAEATKKAISRAHVREWKKAKASKK